MTSEGAARVDEPTRIVIYACFFLLFATTCRSTCLLKVVSFFCENVHIIKTSRENICVTGILDIITCIHIQSFIIIRYLLRDLIIGNKSLFFLYFNIMYYILIIYLKTCIYIILFIYTYFLYSYIYWSYLNAYVV